ncbi:MAG TPA: TRAP transporter small permease [Burkholderiales bacterium]|nr:TRAP transporter small permease [Burkholderiales bacterium]
MLDRALRVLALGGGVVLLGLMALIAFDVVMRYVLRLPFLGAYEMTELAMALIVFLGLPYCAATGGHVAVDVLGGLLDRPAMRWPNALLHLAGAALTAVMAWQSVVYALDSRSRGEATNMLKIDLFPFQVLTGVSMALFTLVLVVLAWRTLRR